MLLFIKNETDTNLKRKVAMDNVYLESFIQNSYPRFQVHSNVLFFWLVDILCMKILSLLLKENELCSYFNSKTNLPDDIRAVIPGLDAHCLNQKLELVKLSKISIRQISVTVDGPLSKVLYFKESKNQYEGEAELYALLNVHNGHKMLPFKAVRFWMSKIEMIFSLG